MSVTTYIAPPSLPPLATAFLALVQPDLERVEHRLFEEISSEVRTIQDLSDHVLRAGGKRLRPAMVALSARSICDEPDPERVEMVGAAVELVHMATLVHDDVIDNTTTRRGKPTANAVWSNGVAVLSGDFLLARSMRLLTDDGDISIIRAVSEITVEMSEGEVLEVLATGNPNISEHDYFEILRKKTAVFVQGCCRVGAMISSAAPAHQSALEEYGYRLGMAFQVADDLLDYTGDPSATGKAIGSDLRDGRATLPFLHAVERADSVQRTALLRYFGNTAATERDIADAVSILDELGALDSARNAALHHVELAAAALEQLPESYARTCFAALTDFVVQRDR